MNFLDLFRISFSATGPFILSFGTYSGLLIFIEVFFNHKIPAPGSKLSYVLYIAFLYIVGIFFEQKRFDSESDRNPQLAPATREVPTQQGQRSFFTNFLSGGYSYLVDWII